ncbi:MAG: hypothetical protein PHW95_02350 [Patescibacteria group bacterium]|nr:hypothetical protein [Patescibacteria group bacterium]
MNYLRRVQRSLPSRRPEANTVASEERDEGDLAPELTDGSDRDSVIKAFTIRLTECLAEMKARDRCRIKLWRSLLGLRRTAEEFEITASEIIGELARQAGINIDLAVLSQEVVLDQPVGKIEENPSEVIAEMFRTLPTLPQFHDFSLDDPWQYGVAHDDRGIGCIGGWFARPGDETFGFHIVTKPSYVGMPSGDNSQPRDERGRFVSTNIA